MKLSPNTVINTLSNDEDQDFTSEELLSRRVNESIYVGPFLRVVVTKGEKSLKIGTFRVDHWFSMTLTLKYKKEEEAGAFIFHLTAFFQTRIIRLYSFSHVSLGEASEQLIKCQHYYILLCLISLCK